MRNKIFKNTSGTMIQFPQRLSDGFNWSPDERIQINHKQDAYGEPGYVVLNIEYCGNYPAYETAWISDKILNNCFTETK